MEKLYNVSPIDSRYHDSENKMRELCSYDNQIREKAIIEFEWFVHVCQEYGIKIDSKSFDKMFYDVLNSPEHILNIEVTTKHDIKAIEYYIRKLISNSDFFHKLTDKEQILALNSVHYTLTSQDIVSLASNKIFSKISNLLIGKIDGILDPLKQVFSSTEILMIGFTHGQPAIPIKSSLIHENYYERLIPLITRLGDLQEDKRTKFGGAIGNNSSSKLAGITDIDEIMDKFVKDYGFIRSKSTTQVDNWVYLIDMLKEYLQISSILIDLCRDIWHYCSINYLCQRKDDGQIGSSTMVQKTNPINFENCEGIMEKLESDFSFYIKKLSKSRLQRDLSDSVVIRMVFESFAMFEVGINSLIKGLSKVELNIPYIESELTNHYEISVEYLQLFLKREGYENSYELIYQKLKEITITDKESFRMFITQLFSDSSIKKEHYDVLMKFDIFDYKKV